MRIGISLGHDVLLDPRPERRSELLGRISAARLDHVAVGDHISFHGGVGFDGMISATAILASQSQLPVVLGVYLLGLRHPLLAARQIATLSELAPGRFVLGVGVGGEDRAEIANSGVDPASRGRRLDESLEIVTRLMTGEAVTHSGEFFDLEQARILPAPVPRPPLVVGGRGDAAVRRTVRFGDGWLGVFCSARRFAQTRSQILEESALAGRAEPTWFGVNVWCGLDADPQQARMLVGGTMESLYRLPPEKFEHLAPAGPPEQVAEWLIPFVDGGAEHVTLVPVARTHEEAVEHSGEVAALLRQHVGAAS